MDDLIFERGIRQFWNLEIWKAPDNSGVEFMIEKNDVVNSIGVPNEELQDLHQRLGEYLEEMN